MKDPEALKESTFQRHSLAWAITGALGTVLSLAVAVVSLSLDLTEHRDREANSEQPEYTTESVEVQYYSKDQEGPSTGRSPLPRDNESESENESASEDFWPPAMQGESHTKITLSAAFILILPGEILAVVLLLTSAIWERRFTSAWVSLLFAGSIFLGYFLLVDPAIDDIPSKVLKFGGVVSAVWFLIFIGSTAWMRGRNISPNGDSWAHYIEAMDSGQWFLGGHITYAFKKRVEKQFEFDRFNYPTDTTNPAVCYMNRNDLLDSLRMGSLQPISADRASKMQAEVEKRMKKNDTPASSYWGLRLTRARQS